MKRDSGTFIADGAVSDTVVTTGQRVRTILGYDDMTGYQGTFKVTPSLQSVDVGGGYTVATGTWTLQGISGAYAGVTGEGRFAGALRAAESPYGGKFLEEDAYEDFAVSLREEARAMFVCVSRRLAEGALAAGDHDLAACLLHRILGR